MASNTYIGCACGASINSAIEALIVKFDEVHGNAEHQKLAMALQMERNEIGKMKYKGR
jgi:hypothetical protein